MPEYLKKFLKKANTTLCIAGVFTLCFIICLIMLSVMGSSNTPKFVGFLIFVSVVGMIFSWLVAYPKYGMAKRNYRWFLKYGNESMLADIDAIKCENPKKNMIFGKYAILSTYNSWFVIPYSQIAWIYVTEANVNYTTKNHSATVYTKDGKKFVLFDVDQEMLADVAQKHIIPYSPDAIIGFGKEQKQRYKQMYRH